MWLAWVVGERLCHLHAAQPVLGNLLLTVLVSQCSNSPGSLASYCLSQQESVDLDFLKLILHTNMRLTGLEVK